MQQIVIILAFFFVCVIGVIAYKMWQASRDQQRGYGAASGSPARHPGAPVEPSRPEWTSATGPQGPSPPASARPSSQDLRIENVGPGGIVHIGGVGPNRQDLDINITAKHTYREGRYTWYELEGEHAGQTVWIEYEHNDTLDVAIALRKLQFADIGLSKRDLDIIDDEERGSFSFEGQRYHYDDSGKAEYLPHGQRQDAEDVYYWDFECEDDKHSISIEKWEDGSYDVTYSEFVEPAQISVFVLNK